MNTPSLLFLLMLAVPSADSLWIQTRDDAHVRIDVHKPLPANWGYSPLRVTIQNDSNRARQWFFDFESNGQNGKTRESVFVIEVPSNGVSTHEIVVPQAGDLFEQSSLSMRVRGFGVLNPGYQYPLSSYDAQGSATVGVSSTVVDAASVTLPGTPVEPKLLPSDWRGLTGLNGLVLGEEDWIEMTPDVRNALLDWVARGGRLVRVGGKEFLPTLYGLGMHASIESDHDKAIAALGGTPRADYAAWIGQRVAPITTRAGWLTVFLVAYALLIGPVNLLVISPQGKRARLLWTMPAFSLGSSAFLATLILLQDGAGGAGHRSSLVYLLPHRNREVVLQEQVSRTGALLGTSFEVAEPVLLFDASGGGWTLARLGSEGARFSGDWFRSRSVQAQRIEAVRPGRARIEKLAGEPGVGVHSMLEDPIETIYYRDRQGSLWTGGGLFPGERRALVPASEQAFEAWWGEVAAMAGPRMEAHLRTLYWERDVYFAKAAGDASHGVIETLEAIRWKQDVLVYAGRLDGEE
ncbi:MAG TPA: hypothetical protein VLK65_29505 [Vicinamibacteria bacterium]|nr:hypothetical protein [Vicinamibacteria bacterium]